MKRKVIFLLGVVIGSLLFLPAYNVLCKPELFKSKDLKGKAKNLFNMDAVESLLSVLLIKKGISVDPQKVMIGKDGWLFLGDGFVHSLKRKIDGSGIHKKEIEEVHQTMRLWDDYFKANGVRTFRIVIGPDKDSVYTDKLPEWDKHHKSQIITSLINDGGELYIRTHSAIMEERSVADMPLYYHTDTHWNAYGASVAFNVLAKSVSAEHPETIWPSTTAKDFKSKEGKPGDLANFLRVTDIHEELVYLDNSDINKTNIELYDYPTGKLILKKQLTVISAPRTPTLVVSDNALNDERVLWLRDSYGSAMSPFMAKTFREVLQVHQGKVNPDLLESMVKSFKPKYVFITSVERDALGRFFTAPPN
ncbi:alginate O-acetyltransferase AlgX-related protein [Enterobacter sp. R1(2018)]|uniref:alginate O-acetyltransferase AlgX-related protein n=1 Tax=Enterobacter sp. R1(2018) TaxID=2447891 RepID=UPI000EABDC14|nr:hypothetical protein [Enterobacter sp. R1(2018)]RKQ38345.1 hypothetical protein D8M09_17175 [Enterobacter sp. R1(2018)]